MQRRLLEILVCPRCLGKLELGDTVLGEEEIIKGRLYCASCELDFAVENGVAIFGMEAVRKEERLKEINGENKWIISANELQAHFDFAQNSAKAGERIIRKLNGKTKEARMQQKLRVLDLGAGWGCFQSWQFAKHGFEVVAAELCPEFIMASDRVAKECFFERIVTDCVTLPFRDCSFDIVFCKELIHHVGNPMDLLGEMWRVSSSRGLIVIEEPCTPVWREKKNNAKTDPAAQVGITHYYYTYRDYLRYMKQIASKLEIDGTITIIDSRIHNILSSLQKLILAIGKVPFLRSFNLKMHLLFVGGSVDILGIKKQKCKAQKRKSRDVIAIEVEALNADQIEFYRRELIPEVFKVFKEHHKT
jgi:ubiquinone/menaquinone biosynthesis C-methylase UbiE/uncharacterized protein YbaR (Trm112 family)